MKVGGFAQGAGIALVAALAGSAVMFVLAGVVAAPLLLGAIVTLLGFAYLFYLLACTGTQVGKVSTMLLWGISTAVTLALDAPLFVQLSVQVGLVWLLRAFFAHRSVLPALADLALCAASLAAALWAAERTGSVFITIWCVLLVQAAWVAIPRREPSPRAVEHFRANGDERFSRAERTAEAAVRRLSTAL